MEVSPVNSSETISNILNPFHRFFTQNILLRYIVTGFLFGILNSLSYASANGVHCMPCFGGAHPFVHVQTTKNEFEHEKIYYLYLIRLTYTFNSIVHQNMNPAVFKIKNCYKSEHLFRFKSKAIVLYM